MQRGLLGLASALLILACTAADNTAVDAAPLGPDAPGPACTRALYDTCTSDTQCDSNNCQVFDAATLHVCSQTCTGATPCPMQNGQVVTCTTNGFCRPPRSSGCTPN